MVITGRQVAVTLRVNRDPQQTTFGLCVDCDTVGIYLTSKGYILTYDLKPPYRHDAEPPVDIFIPWSSVQHLTLLPEGNNT